MTVLDYSAFYRKYGIRRMEYLASPRTWPIADLELPKDSLVHYIDEQGLTTGPIIEEPYLRKINRMIMVDHVTHLDVEKGVARPLVIPINNIIREYHTKNRKTRPLRNLESSDKDQMTLIMESYALLPKLYKYITSYFSGYNSWWNIHSTVLNKINKLLALTERNHFIFIELPKNIPSLQLFKENDGKNEVTRRLIQTVPESNSWFMLDFWKWMGEHREFSMWNRIDDKGLEKINLIFIESGRWSVINLGLLNQWRSDHIENDKTVVQRRWLRYIITLLTLRSVNTDNLTTVVPEPPVVEHVDVPEHPESPKVEDVVETEDEFHNATTDEIDRVEDLDPESDFKELVELTESTKPIKKTTYDKHQNKDTHPEEVVTNIAKEMMDAGLLTAIDYKNIAKTAARYKEIKDPFHSGKTIAEAMAITKEDIKIPDNRNIVGTVKGVSDVSMLNSSLEHFDSQYIEKVLPKDILNSVISIQNAGIAVQNYDIETVETLNDHYQIHTVKVAPVVGRPSTLRFKLPVVDKNGVFVANGVKYRLRKQRGD